MGTMNAKVPPLQMLNHFFVMTSVIADQSAMKDSNEGKPFGYKFDLDVKHSRNPEKPGEHQVQLTVKTSEHPGHAKGYDVVVAVVGFFQAVEGYPEDKIDEMISVLGPTLLYGAIREYLYTVTLRGPFPPIYLPTTSFIPSVPESGQGDENPPDQVGP